MFQIHMVLMSTVWAAGVSQGGGQGLGPVQGGDGDCPAECDCAHVEGRLTTDCSNEQLTSIPEGLPTKSMSLKLSGNRFMTALNVPGLFYRAHLTSIVSIDLSGSEISKIANHLFANLSILETIDLSRNSLESVPAEAFTGLPKLKRLDLSNNLIEQIPEFSFRGAPLLEEIRLSSNMLTYIYNQAFKNCIKLKRIYLNGNRFSNLDERAFERLSELKLLNLEDNPFKCDCYLRDFVLWEKDRYLTPPPKCDSPDINADKTWAQLTAPDFACPPKFSAPSTSKFRTASEGQSMTFTCPVQGDPKPKISWEFEPSAASEGGNRRKEELEHSVKYQFRTATHQLKPNTWMFHLKVTDLHGADSGAYYCTASNHAGMVYRAFELSLNDYSPADGHSSSANSSPNNAQSASKNSAGGSGGGQGESGVGFLANLRASGDLYLICGVIVAALIILSILLIAVCCYRRGQADYAHHQAIINDERYFIASTTAEPNNQHFPQNKTTFNNEGGGGGMGNGGGVAADFTSPTSTLLLSTHNNNNNNNNHKSNWSSSADRTRYRNDNQFNQMNPHLSEDQKSHLLQNHDNNNHANNNNHINNYPHDDSGYIDDQGFLQAERKGGAMIPPSVRSGSDTASSPSTLPNEGVSNAKYYTKPSYLLPDSPTRNKAPLAQGEKEADMKMPLRETAL